MRKVLIIKNIHNSGVQLLKSRKDFNSKESFSKKEPITEWEKANTLDC